MSKDNGKNVNLDPRDMAKCGYPGGLRDSPLNLDKDDLKPRPKGMRHPPCWEGGDRGD